MAWYRSGGSNPSGTISITSNGTHNVAEYESANVNVPGVIEVSTDAGMIAVLTSANVGKAYKFTGTTGTYTNGDIYIVEDNPLAEPLCFTANTAGSTIAFNVGITDYWTGNYSTDGITWNAYESGTVLTLTNVGDKVYFKGTLLNVAEEDPNVFTMTGSIAASGNIMSLCNGDNFVSDNVIHFDRAFWFTFDRCSALTSAPLLPATTLRQGCYYSMFSNCTSLTTVPNLPATTLANDCYFCMFDGCHLLQVSDTQTTAAPYAWILPQSSTFTNTYSQESMFSGCAGTRSSDDMAGAQGQSYTYYTQNVPV